MQMVLEVIKHDEEEGLLNEDGALSSLSMPGSRQTSGSSSPISFIIPNANANVNISQGVSTITLAQNNAIDSHSTNSGMSTVTTVMSTVDDLSHENEKQFSPPKLKRNGKGKCNNEHDASSQHNINNNEQNPPQSPQDNDPQTSDHHRSLSSLICLPNHNSHDDHLSIYFKKVMKAFKKHFFQPAPPPVPAKYCRPAPRILLAGMETPYQHWDEIYRIIDLVGSRKGKEGLDLIGLEYRRVTHYSSPSSDPNERSNYTTELYHISSNEKITLKNRKKFIADGEMYELVVRLAQEHAQKLMVQEGDLEWRSVCEEERLGNPIRLLVSKVHPLSSLSHHEWNDNVVDVGLDDASAPKESKLLLITTGKGKVRAGIFSRQHLLISSIESSTALPMVIGAKHRGMKMAILDPNARGDRNGMATYEQSMTAIFGCAHESNECNGLGEIGEMYDSDEIDSATLNGSRLSTVPQTSIYALVHSASGSQLAGYLKEKGRHLLPSIKSIAFTDSTHSIQWIKNDESILTLFQSEKSIYVRSSNENRDYHWDKHKAGDVCKHDPNWVHRFGSVRTIWAGTKDHSLCNWTAIDQIWQHFDSC